MYLINTATQSFFQALESEYLDSPLDEWPFSFSVLLNFSVGFLNEGWLWPDNISLKFFSSLILGIIIQYCSLSFLPPYIYIYRSYSLSSLWPLFSLIVAYIYVHVHKYTFLNTICLVFIMRVEYVFMVVPWVLGNQLVGFPQKDYF